MITSNTLRLVAATNDAPFSIIHYDVIVITRARSSDQLKKGLRFLVKPIMRYACPDRLYVHGIDYVSLLYSMGSVGLK